MALTANTYLPIKNISGMTQTDGVVLTSSVIYHHALVVRRSSGKLAPAADNGTSTRFIGLADLSQKATAATSITGDGTLRVNCLGDIDVLIAAKTSVTAGHVGTAAYCFDDATVTNLTTLGPQCGIFIEFVAANSVWVRLRAAAMSAAT